MKLFIAGEKQQPQERQIGLKFSTKYSNPGEVQVILTDETGRDLSQGYLMKFLVKNGKLAIERYTSTNPEFVSHDSLSLRAGVIEVDGITVPKAAGSGVSTGYAGSLSGC